MRFQDGKHRRSSSFLLQEEKSTPLEHECSGVVQMWKSWCFSVWAASLCGKSLSPGSQSCVRRRPRWERRKISFFICSRRIIMTMFTALRVPRRRCGSLFFRWNDMCLRCRARFLSGCTQATITSHDEPAWPPAAGVGLGRDGVLQVTWCINKSLHNSLSYHEPGRSSRCWEAIEPLWLPAIHGCWQWSHPIALLWGVVELFQVLQAKVNEVQVITFKSATFT